MKRCALFVMVIGVLAQGVFAAIMPPVRQISIGGTVMDDPYPMKRASMPVQGAKVELWMYASVVYKSQSSAVVPPQILWDQVDSAVTTAQGAFAFKPVMPAETYQIRCSSPGYNAYRVNLVPLKDTLRTILLVASGARAKVAGTVWAACTGVLGMPCIASPVAGCTVMVTKGAAQFDPTLYASYQTTTNSIGQYGFDSIPVQYNGERVTVSAGKAGFVAQSADSIIRNATTTTVNFTLASSAAAPRDTVFVTPVKPTTRDSLQFTLRNTGHCCATVFHNRVVSVTDSMILLSYNYDDSLCASIRCLVGGSTTNFSSTALKAGRYGIYKVESMYCPPGRACPMLLTAQVRVGTLTVTTPSGVGPLTGAAAIKPANALSITGSSVAATVARSGRVTIRAYDVRGVLLGEVYSGWMGAGTQVFSLGRVVGKAGARGTVLVRLSAGGVATTAKAIVLSH